MRNSTSGRIKYITSFSLNRFYDHSSNKTTLFITGSNLAEDLNRESERIMARKWHGWRGDLISKPEIIGHTSKVTRGHFKGHKSKVIVS